MDAQLTILDEIGARLANMTITNGYRIDIQSIKRASLTPFKNGDLPAVNYWPTEDILDTKTGQIDHRQLAITIEIYDVTRDDPFTDLAIQYGNDVIKALFRATSAPLTTDTDSPALGGLINKMIINSITPVLGEGQRPWFGAVLELIIEYNVTVGDFSTIENF